MPQTGPAGPVLRLPLYVQPSFQGFRHFPTGARHWGASAEVQLCSKRIVFFVAEFSLDATGFGTICGMCVCIAQKDLGIAEAEEYVDGQIV